MLCVLMIKIAMNKLKTLLLIVLFLLAACSGGNSSDDTATNISLELSAGSPSNSLSAGTHSSVLSLSTNKNAVCKYSNTVNTLYSDMTNTFSVTGGTSHTQVLSGLTNGTSYRYYVRCADDNTVTTADYVIAFAVSAAISDTTPPVLTAPVITPAATSAHVQFSTDEATAVTVDYGLTTAYGNQVTATLATLHGIVIPNLALDTTYHIKITARDAAGNQSVSNDMSFITLAVAGGVAGGNDITVITTDTAPNNEMVLTLDTPYSVANVPIRTGVPFAYGVLSSVDHLRLDNDAGTQEIPAQFNVLANWPDGSIKSVLVQFMADTSGSTQTYRLAYGSNVSRTAFGSALVVARSNDKVVDTGAIKFIINSQGLVSSLWQDSNNDQQFATDEKVIGSSELFAVNAFDNLEYTASQASDSQVIIEENGPIRAVIKATGSLTNGNSDTLIKYLIRYYAYANSDKIDIEYTLIDDRPETDVHKAESYRNPGSLALSVSAYGLRINYLDSGSTQYRFGGEADAVYNGTVSGEHYLLQQGEFIYDNGVDSHTFNYSGVGTGSRAAGWMALDSGNKHMAIAVKDFWQQFPNELSIDNQTLTVSLHPKRASGILPDTSPLTQGEGGTTNYVRPNTFYFSREGGAKTYQMRLSFADTTPDNATLQAANHLFQSNDLLLKATPEWYTASGVFGNLSVGTSTSGDTGFDAHMMRDFYEPSMVEEKQATNFGWRDYGDRLRAGWSNTVNGVRIPGFYNDTHVGATNFFKLFLRTGDQRWYSLAQVSTRHFMDIDVSHAPRQGYWSGFGAPMQPAGEIHAIKHDMVDHSARNVHQGHAHASGLIDYYLLTGDKRAREVMQMIADWWKFMVPYMYPLPFEFEAPNNRGGYREATRDYGWPLFVMNEYVRLTGDADYHRNTSAHLVKYLISWWQTRRERIGYDAETDTLSNTPMGKFNDASEGTGFWTMTRAGNYGAYNQANGTSPWMAGSLIGNLIGFYERDKEFNAVANGSGINHGVLKDMLFQTINYVVKNGYDETNDRFVYAETIRSYGGGRSHIIYPLAYLNRLYKEEFNDGNIVHPEWYDKRTLWETIATETYNDYINKVARQYTQSYGWYGYEIPHTLDFFKIMQP